MTTTPIEQAREAIEAGRFEEAVALLKPLTNTGDAEADYLYGSLLFYGPEIVEIDDAMDAFARAAELDHPAACYQVATTLIDDEDGVILGPVVDRDLLVRAAELGHVEAQRTVGVLHVHGEEGFPEDLAITRHWYERAAEQGEPQSQFDLGCMMLDGEGGPVDPDAGFRWLETCAAQEGDASIRAADFLATIFEEGRYDIEPDPEETQRWRARHDELVALDERARKDAAADAEQDA